MHRIGGAVLIAVVMLLTATSAGAAGPLTWAPEVPADTVNGLSGLACPTTTLCVAGGAGVVGSATSDTIAYTTNPGGAGPWTSVQVPVTTTPGAAILAMECPSASRCVAIDGNGHVLSSSDPTGGPSAWQSTYLKNEIDQTRTLSSLSCPSASLCVAVDGGVKPAILTSSDGVNWAASSTGNNWRAVSCSTAGGCVAIDAIRAYYTTQPAGPNSGWKVTSIVPFNGTSYTGDLTGVKCTPGFCLISDFGSATVPTQTWSTTDPSGATPAWTNHPNSPFNGFACAGSGAVLCAGWTIYGAFVSGSINPTGGIADWIATKNVTDDGDHIRGVSCPTTALCVAVTGKGYAAVAAGLPVPGHTPDPGSTTPSSTGTPIGPAHETGSSYPGAGLYGNDSYAVSGNAVSFLLQSAANSTGVLTGETFSSFAAAAAKRRAHKVSIGRAKFTLVAGRRKRVTLKLTKAAAKLLKARHTLKVRMTIDAHDASGNRHVTTKVVTLKVKAKPRPKRR